MADKEQKSVKSCADAKRGYDSLAKQCTELAARLPKIRVEIEKRVKEEMGKAESQLTELKSQKAAAAREMYEAEQREAPDREAKAAAEAEAKRAADQKAQAEANATRKAAEVKALQQRAADATK